jgi:hypothetical protein
MANYAWEFGAEGTGLWFTITYNSDTNELTVSSLEGKFDFNALWFGDGDNTAGELGGTTLSKADNSLNMNGSGAVFDDYIKFSSAGLGAAGENKDTFISEGETKTLSLSGADAAFLETALASPDFQIGVRATSVNGGDSIKAMGSEIPLPTIDVVKTASLETFDEGTPTDITYTYTVENTSEHETFNDMTLVSLVDDNGTPDDTGDDVDLLTGFVANLSYGVYYTGGDDGDYVLELGEIWNFSYTIEDVVENAGWTNTNIVTAVGESKNLQVSDFDDATVTAVNVDPGVEVTKVGSVNQVEDIGQVTYTYTVTNTSSASTDPLTLVSLVDDMGTPGNPGDDVNLLAGFVAGSSYGAHYVGGDDGDYVLSQGETWTFDYDAVVTVADGDSLTNVVTVSAKDDENNTVGDTAEWTVANPLDGNTEDPRDTGHAVSHVTFYFHTPDYAGDKKPNPGGDGWYTVKIDEFDEGPEVSNSEFLDDLYAIAVSKILADNPDNLDVNAVTLAGVALKGGTVETYFDTNAADAFVGAPPVYSVENNEVDLTYQYLDFAWA